MKSFIGKVIVRTLMIGFFFGVWIVLIFLHIYMQKDGFFTLRYPHNESFTTSSFNKELLAHELFTGQFVAKEDYLGIVALNVNTFYRKNSDSLAFRIKEEHQQDWYYERIYPGKRIPSSGVYTFGFPKIVDAKNKRFIFQIESVKGKEGNAFAITDNYPALITKYEIPRSTVVYDKKILGEFLLRKFTLAFYNRDYYFAFLIYLFPFLFYISWLIFLRNTPFEKEKKFITEKKDELRIFTLFLIYKRFLFVYLILAGLLIDIFLIHKTDDLVIFVLCFLWIFTLNLYKLETSVSFIVALAFLVLCPFFALLGINLVAEKLAFWGYMYLWLGVIQLCIDMGSVHRKRIGIPIITSLLLADSKDLVYRFLHKRKKSKKM